MNVQRKVDSYPLFVIIQSNALPVEAPYNMQVAVTSLSQFSQSLLITYNEVNFIIT